MIEAQWQRLIAALRNVDDIDGAVAAAGELQRAASAEVIPRLLELLRHSSFFVREAAAWPLSDMECVDLLPELLDAYQMGFDEGHDNDGFTAALIDLVSAKPDEARSRLQAIAKGSAGPRSSNAQWLIEFCEQHDA